MAERAPLTPEGAVALGAAVGLHVPSDLAGGVAARLNAVASAAERWRPTVDRDVVPFLDFELPRPEAAGAGTAGARVRQAASAAAATGPGPTAGTGPTDRTWPARTPDDAGDLFDLAASIRERRLSPVAVAEEKLRAIAALNGELIAYLTVAGERALADAERAERELAQGVYRGPLHGVPIAHKDLIPTKGIRTTYHTAAFKDNVPDEDAPIVKRLARAGTVLLGKANTLELGSGDGDVFGLARNPWDPARQVGGSSSGSAVAVAAGLAAAATGTDAGGSIRIPAAFCGIVGVKPTAGLVEVSKGTNGISVTGPMTRTTLDAALMLEVMTGDTGLTERVTGDVAGLTVGMPVDWLDTPLEDEIASSMQHALDVLRGLGASVREVRLPHASASEVLGGVVTHVDNFAKYRFLLEQGAQLGKFVHELLLAAELYPAAAYRLGQRLRRLMVEEVTAAHATADILITPMVPYRAARLGETELRIGATTVNPRTGQGRFTRLSNLTGFPSLSVPTGFDSNGMPLSVQLHGRPFEEAVILSAARAIELNNDKRSARPRFHA